MVKAWKIRPLSILSSRIFRRVPRSVHVCMYLEEGKLLRGDGCNDLGTGLRRHCLALPQPARRSGQWGPLAIVGRVTDENEK